MPTCVTVPTECPALYSARSAKSIAISLFIGVGQRLVGQLGGFDHRPAQSASGFSVVVVAADGNDAGTLTENGLIMHGGVVVDTDACTVDDLNGVDAFESRVIQRALHRPHGVIVGDQIAAVADTCQIVVDPVDVVLGVIDVIIAFLVVDTDLVDPAAGSIIWPTCSSDFVLAIFSVFIGVVLFSIVPTNFATSLRTSSIVLPYFLNQ